MARKIVQHSRPSVSFGQSLVRIINEGSRLIDSVILRVLTPNIYDWFLVNFADRLYPWQASCGIPGGIPTRTVIHTTFGPGATAAQINSATLAASNVYLSSGIGQVVALNAGAYTANGVLYRTGVTIRGAGPGVTTVDGGTGTAFTTGGSTFSFTGTYGQAIASGSWLNRGSYSITFSATPGSEFQVGRLIMINQSDDNYVAFGRPAVWYGFRNYRHVSRITAINGNTVTFDTPIPYSFTYSLTPRAQAIAPAAILGGVENLTIRGEESVDLTAADRCWLYKVEATAFGYDGIHIASSHRVEIRRCYVHETVGWPNQAEGLGIWGEYCTGNLLMEDNIGSHYAHLFIMNGDTASAYLNNYSSGTGYQSFAWIMPDMNCNHGPHCIMSLWEGNMLARWQNDTYHGSASHQTIFRNNVHGIHPSFVADRWLMDLPKASYFFNAIGNVIGHSSWAPTAYQASKYAGGAGYITRAVDRWSDALIWRLGYPNPENGSLTLENPWTGYTPPGGTYPDSYVYDKATPRYLLRHGNYDYYNHAAVWDADISARDIPNSLFHTSKPAYFGSLAWPNVGPDIPGLVRQTPSMARWLRYDPAQGGDGLLPTLFADEGTEVDLYLDWHTGADGNLITDAIAAGSCRPTSPANALDVYPGTTLNAMRIETDSASPVAGLVRVGGTAYNFNATTQGARYDHTSEYADVVTANIAANIGVMSMGFMYKTNMNTEYSWHAESGMNGSGEWAVLAPRYFGGQQHLYMHCNSGYSASAVNINNDTWYWITMQYNRTTRVASLAVYLASTMAKVGSTITLALISSPPYLSYWQVGQASQAGYTEPGKYTWYGPCIFDWTDGTFPLLPA